MIEISIVNMELNKVLSKMSQMNLNWKASKINNTIWCNTTDTKINEKRSGVKESFSFIV
jgi:hypothetical protein